MHSAHYTQLPLRPYASPGPHGYDRDFVIDWGYALRGTFHAGDDIAVRAGTPVFAIAHGVLRLAIERGSPATRNWGWVLVLEHAMRDGSTWCSIYGHAAPTVYRVGDFVPTGSVIARIADYVPVKRDWVNHLHFAVRRGAFSATPGKYPSWLTGYLAPKAFPASYVDPYRFCLERFPKDLRDGAGGERDPRAIRSNAALDGEAIDVPGDEDWFSLQGKRGQAVSLCATREYGDLVPQLAVFERAARGGAGRKVAGSGIAGSRNAFTQEDWRVRLDAWPLPADGRYLVKIRGAGTTTGVYRFEKRID